MIGDHRGRFSTEISIGIVYLSALHIVSRLLVYQYYKRQDLVALDAHTATMSSYSDTARLSANPDLHFDDPHPDLLPSEPRDSNAIASSSTSGSEHRGMIKGMTARYDKNTKLATGTTMDEYRRLNMRATTVGMWGGIFAGGLISACHVSSTIAIAKLTLSSCCPEETDELISQCPHVQLPLYVHPLSLPDLSDTS